MENPVCSTEQLVGPDWTVDVVHPILDLLSYIRTERLIMTKMTEYKHFPPFSSWSPRDVYLGGFLSWGRIRADVSELFRAALGCQRCVSVVLQSSQ